MEDFSARYNELLKEAELVDLRYGVKGFVVIRPNAMAILKRMYRIYEDVLEKYNHKPVHFPAVIPESYFKKEEEHIKGFEGEVFWITRAGYRELEEKLLLRPTSETAMYPLYALWIKGKKDLPLKLYQSGTVWRYETKATRPLLRAREILWIEAHCAFANEEAARRQIEEDKRIAEEVIANNFGIPFIFLRRPEWDKFAGALETYAADTIMPDGKVLQIATTHLLGENFAKAFNVKYMDEDGEHYVWQTCYGPGMMRILAALIAWFSDEKGLIVPFHLANTQIVIVPIFKEETKEKVMEYARKVKEKLGNYRVVLDESDETPGFKFNKWEQMGVPIRVEVGIKEAEANTVTVALRHNRKRITLNLNELDKVEQLAREMFEELKRKHEERFASSIVDVESWEELSHAIKNGKIARASFCSIGEEGRSCYEKIKEELKAEVRGERGERKPGKCIVCGKPTDLKVYIARQY